MLTPSVRVFQTFSSFLRCTRERERRGWERRRERGRGGGGGGSDSDALSASGPVPPTPAWAALSGPACCIVPYMLHRALHAASGPACCIGPYMLYRALHAASCPACCIGPYWSLAHQTPLSTRPWTPTPCRRRSGLARPPPLGAPVTPLPHTGHRPHPPATNPSAPARRGVNNTAVAAGEATPASAMPAAKPASGRVSLVLFSPADAGRRQARSLSRNFDRNQNHFYLFPIYAQTLPRVQLPPPRPSRYCDYPDRGPRQGGLPAV